MVCENRDCKKCLIENYKKEFPEIEKMIEDQTKLIFKDVYTYKDETGKGQCEFVDKELTVVCRDKKVFFRSAEGEDYLCNLICDYKTVFLAEKN